MNEPLVIMLFGTVLMFGAWRARRWRLAGARARGAARVEGRESGPAGGMA